MKRRRSPTNPALEMQRDDELMTKLEALELDVFMLSAVAGTIVNRLADSCQLKPHQAEVLSRYWDGIHEQLELLLSRARGTKGSTGGAEARG